MIGSCAQNDIHCTSADGVPSSHLDTLVNCITSTPILYTYIHPYPSISKATPSRLSGIGRPGDVGTKKTAK